MKKKALIGILISAFSLCGCNFGEENSNSNQSTANDDTTELEKYSITKEEYNHNKDLILLKGYVVDVAQIVRNVENKIDYIYYQHADHEKQNFYSESPHHPNGYIEEKCAIKDGIHFDLNTGKIIDIYDDIRNAPYFINFANYLPSYETLSIVNSNEKLLYTCSINNLGIKIYFYENVLTRLYVINGNIETIFYFNEVGTPGDDFRFYDYQINDLDVFEDFFEKTSLYVGKRIFYKGEDFTYSTFKSRKTSTSDRSFSYPNMDQIVNKTNEYFVKYDHDSGIAIEKYTTGESVYHVPTGSTGRNVYSEDHEYLYSSYQTPEAYMVEKCPQLYSDGGNEMIPRLNLLKQNNFIKEFTGLASGVNFEGHLIVKPEAVTYTNVSEIYLSLKVIENDFILECDQYFPNGEMEVWICVCTREANHTIIFN